MPSSPDGDHPAARPLAALATVAPARGRPRKLDRPTVTRAALAIVDRDGLGGLTMRRVADRLGVGLATLYNAVGSKEAILDDMIEAVFGRLPEIDPAGGSALDGLVRLWTDTHALLLDSPVVAQLTALKPAGGPGLFRLVESTLALLRRAGVDPRLVTTAFETIRGYTLGFTLLRISRSDPAATATERRLARASELTPDRYPEIVAFTPELASAITGEGFEQGLRHLVLGFLPAAG